MKFLLVTWIALAATASAVPVEITQRSLDSDFKELLALIPFEDIQSVFYRYLESDEEIQSAFDYFTSEEVLDLLQEVENMAEIKNFLNYLQSKSLPAYEFLNKLNDALGIDKIMPKRSLSLESKEYPPGIRGFLSVLRGMIPWKKVCELYKNKLETSKDFQELLARLKSPESQGFVDKLMEKQQFQNLLSYVEDKGVDVQKIFNSLNSILGLHFPVRPRILMWYQSYQALLFDIRDFLKLLPHKEFNVIFKKYWKNDVKFRDALVYLDSEEFAENFLNVEMTPEFNEMLSFLEETGLPAYKFMEIINNIMGLPSLEPPGMFGPNQDLGGFSGFLKEMQENLPADAIKMMYEEKMKTSMAFQNFVHQMESPKAAEVFKKFMATKEMQMLRAKSMEHGINFNEIHNFLLSNFGLIKFMHAR